MAKTNLSLANPLIAGYFNGSNTYVPTSELMYIHTHPLVTPNFLNEIEEAIKTTTQEFKNKKLTGMPVEKLTDYAVKLGKLLPSISTETAPEILSALRDIYQFCINMQKTLKR